MLCQGSSPTVEDCRFTDCFLSAYTPSGAGLRNEAGSQPSVTRCVFEANSVNNTGTGGGMSNVESSPTITDCLFIGKDVVIAVGDDLDESIGRFRIDARFDPAAFPNGSATDPREVDLEMYLGVMLTLPFALTPDSVITVTGGVEAVGRAVRLSPTPLLLPCLAAPRDQSGARHRRSRATRASWPPTPVSTRPSSQ